MTGCSAAAQCAAAVKRRTVDHMLVEIVYALGYQ